MNKNNNNKIRVILPAIFLIIAGLIWSVTALQFIDNNQSDFNNGTYNNTFYNTTIGAVQLNGTFNNGTFTSRVFDGGGLTNWTNISWTEGAPYQEELPNNQVTESTLNGINMTGNILLFHLNNDSDFGENNTHIYDFSGNEHNGTWNGDSIPDADSGPTTSGKLGGAFMFDGTGDSITDSLNDGTKTFTISTWVKPDVLSGVRGCVGYTTSSGVRQDIYHYNQVVRIFADGKYYSTTSNVITQTGKWHHIVGTYNEGDAKPKVYVNGIEYALGGSSNIGTYSANQFWVGRIAPNGNYHYNGAIDEVAIWNRTLSAEEILNTYKRGTLRLNLTTKSCNTFDCSDASWNQTFENSPSDLNIKANRYFQYKTNFFTENSNYSPELYNVTINYNLLDNTSPTINLESPQNNTLNQTDKTPDFVFNATDETASTLSCSLWMNKTSGGTAEIKATNSSVNNGTSTTITPASSLADNEYLWWIECSDGTNTNVSETRAINISVGDTQLPTIELVTPTNNTVNTTSNTPAFSFIPEDDLAETLSCELWLNATTSGVSKAYGIEDSAISGNTATITANESLSNQNYTWWVNCSDGGNTNISEIREIEIFVEVNPPEVNLDSPTNNQNNVDFENVVFNCSATDDVLLKNISLYSDYKGAWQFIESKDLTGTSNSTTFTKNILQNNQFTNNHFTWNCLAHDDSSKSNWSEINYTFSNWDLGSHSNTKYNNTLNALTLDDYSSNGIYTSQIFNAGSIVGWKNISWSDETNSGGELPDNKGSDSRIDMKDNRFLAHLNDGDGTTTFDDASGENNDGSCSGETCPTWDTTGKYNGAFEFNSSNRDIITGPSSNTLTGDNSQTLTISLWFKTTSTEAMYPASLKRQSVAEGYSTLFSISLSHGGTGNVGLLTYDSGGSHTYLDVPGSYNDGEWHQLTGIINASNRTVYIDGVPKASDLEGISAVTGNTAEFTIGGFAQSYGSLFFDGTLDEVAVWNRSLSSEEISKIYNQTATSLNLTVRSCNSPNCDDGAWSSQIINSTFSELPVSNNQYFQYKVTSESTGSSVTPKLYNITFNYGNTDSQKPSINIISPANNAGDNGNTTTFSYNVTDESSISNCELILNGISQDTDNSITKDTTQGFSLSSLSQGTYNWNLNCTDINGNQNSSETRVLTIIPSYEFTGQTTDLSQVDIEDIANLLLEEPVYGLINFSETINLSGGANINQYVTITNNSINIDSENIPQLNKSARLTLYNLDLDNPIILKDGFPCDDCSIISYDASGNLTFDVQHFTNYSASENSQLEIWDDTDLARTFGGDIKFYANFTNSTNNQPIAAATCYINFSDASSTMTYNSGLYEYNKTLGVGVHYYNISCSASGYTTINLTDHASVETGNAPSGANVTVISSERAPIDPPGNVSAYAGNVTELSVTAHSTTQSWQGYFGNVSGTIQLTDGSDNVLYNWSTVSPNGEVYATRAFDVNFATVSCAESSVISTEEAFIGQLSSDADSVSNTFTTPNHPEFFVGAVNISMNSCNSTNIYGPSGVQSFYFYEVLLADGASNIIYTSILEQGKQGFDTMLHDFEMIVGEDGHEGNIGTTNYYFYVELQ